MEEVDRTGESIIITKRGRLYRYSRPSHQIIPASAAAVRIGSGSPMKASPSQLLFETGRESLTGRWQTTLSDLDTNVLIWCIIGNTVRPIGDSASAIAHRNACFRMTNGKSATAHHTRKGKDPGKARVFSDRSGGRI